MEIPYKNKHSLSAKDYELLDDYAWEAICNWHKFIGFNPIYRGVDFNHLIRFFLWDKVARAIRFKHELINTKKERQLVDSFEPIVVKTVIWRITKKIIFLLKNIWYFLSFFIFNKYDVLRLIINRKQKHLIFVPTFNKRTRLVCEKLFEEDLITIVAQEAFMPNLLVINKNNCTFFLDTDWSKKLYEAVILGLLKQSVILTTCDQNVLKTQINKLVHQFNRIEKELKFLKPDLIYLHSDNHFPYITYVLLAKKYNIPTFIVQHGLDCEYKVLDEAYAENIAVWGLERKKRYEMFSSNKPNIKVTGNPSYSSIRISENIKIEGDFIVWFTRPHHPKKCYSVSRSVEEGVKILETLCTFLQENINEQLIIKPHPSTSIQLYKKIINNSQAAQRISIFTGDPKNILSQAKIVLSEDSTMGLEALFYGKLLINVHFSPRAPVIPYVKYQTAIRAFNPKELYESLEKYMTIDYNALGIMNINRKKFIYDFAHKMDGSSIDNTIAFIKDILAEPLVNQ